MTRLKLKQLARGEHSKLQNIPFTAEERKNVLAYLVELFARLEGKKDTSEDRYFPSTEIIRAVEIAREGISRLIGEVCLLGFQDTPAAQGMTAAPKSQNRKPAPGRVKKTGGTHESKRRNDG